MQNFLQFLKRFANFFLFVVLELACVYLIVQNNHFQRARFFSSSGYLSAGLLDARHGLTSFLNLKDANQTLIEEQKMLLKKVYNRPVEPPDSCAFESDIPIDSLIVNEDSILYLDRYAFIPATVIAKSTNRLHNYFTIDRGSNSGIEPEMGVITGSGVVGLVKSVSNQYATVMTILHKKMRLSAKIQRNNYFGSISWDGQDPFYAQLNDIPVNVLVKEGDTIITSGYSSFFPNKIPIGVVENVDLPTGNNFQKIEVKLLPVFGEIEYVFAVKRNDIEEIKALQESQETD